MTIPDPTPAPETTTVEAPAAPAAPAVEAPAPKTMETHFASLRERLGLDKAGEVPAEVAETATPDAPADPAAETVPEAGAAAEDLDAAPADPEPSATVLLAKLPGRRPEDPDFELPLDREALRAAGIDPQEAEQRLEQLRAGYMRRQQVATELERVAGDRAELDSIEEALRTDAPSFLSERVPASVQEAVVLKLLPTLSPEAWERVAEHAAKWDKDPAERSREATAEENKRLRAEQTRRQQTDQTKQDLSQAKDIGSTIAALVPEEWAQAKGDRFFDLCVDQLKRHIAQHNLKNLDHAQVPRILADLGVLEDYGIALDADASPAVRQTPAVAAQPKKGSATPAQVEAAKRAGKDLQARVDNRRSAAATSPAGAGAGTSGLQVPKGQTGQGRIDWLREKFGIAK